LNKAIRPLRRSTTADALKTRERFILVGV